MTTVANTIDWDRYSYRSLETEQPDAKGRLFITDRCRSAPLVDLSTVKVCHVGVDSIRQLFTGILRSGWQRWIPEDLPEFTHLMGIPFAVGRLGKQSGYRVRLQNNDMGVIILVGSYYKRLEHAGAHLKVELSPHFIAQHSIESIDKWLDEFARQFFEEYAPTGVALHLAADIQGWDVPDDFEHRFVTLARRSAKYLGPSEMDFTTGATIYGKRETFMFGKANALQFALYRKDIEAQVRDKVDYWNATWDAYTFGAFEPDKPVWRAEMRFHHNVVAELGASFDKTLHSWKDAAEHLGDLWRYALTRNRLMHNDRLIDPLWQLLRDDLTFYVPPTGRRLYRQRKSDVGAVGRNVALVLGNMLSLLARHNVTRRDAYKAIRQLAIWNDIDAYFKHRGGIDALKDFIERGLLQRRLTGKAA